MTIYVVYRDSGDFYEPDTAILGYTKTEENANSLVNEFQKEADKLLKQKNDIWELWYNSLEYKNEDYIIERGPIWEECNELESKLFPILDENLSLSFEARYGYYSIEEIK